MTECAATPEPLVDRVAEAMTGWPLDTTTEDDAESWRANARAAISTVADAFDYLHENSGYNLPASYVGCSDGCFSCVRDWLRAATT